MKKIVVLLMVAIMTALMLVPVNAEAVTTDIFKGTPVVDGVLDDMYKESVAFKLGTPNFYTWGDGAEEVQATAYFVWDESYMYLAVDVTDGTKNSRGLTGDDAINVWQNDAAECWFLDNGLKSKIHAAADGAFWLGGDGDGTTDFDFSKCVHAAAYTATGYVVEMGLPMNDLKVGREFGFDLQINNITDDDATNGGASGSQNPDGCTLKCSANEVTPPVIEVEEEVVDEVAAEAAPAAEEAAPAAATTAAQTFDATVIMAVAAVVSGLGVAVVSKKRG